MNMWKEETLRFLQLGLQQPGGIPLLIGTASVVALVFIVLLRFVSAAFRITNAGWLQRLTATVLVLTLPLAATVTVAGNGRPVHTDPAHGDYYKLLDTGTYQITFSAPGYITQTVSNVATI
jgi:hypothetical protein